MSDKDRADAEAAATRAASAEDGRINAGVPHAPKRRFWQIHLSTAIVLMSVTVGFALANIKKHRKNNVEVSSTKVIECGWPLTAFSVSTIEADGNVHVRKRWNEPRAFLNALFLFVLLIFCAYLSEYVIRRHEARKPWFKIHLSTAVILMFVSGVMIGGWVSLMTFLGKNPDSAYWVWYVWLLETRIGIIAMFTAPPFILLIIAWHFEDLISRRGARKP